MIIQLEIPEELEDDDQKDRLGNFLKEYIRAPISEKHMHTSWAIQHALSTAM